MKRVINIELNWLYKCQEKIYFKSKQVTTDKGHYTLIKRLIQQKHEIIINIYEPNNRVPKIGSKN